MKKLFALLALSIALCAQTVQIPLPIPVAGPVQTLPGLLNPGDYAKLMKAAANPPVTSVNGRTGAVVIAPTVIPAVVSAFRNDVPYLTLATLPTPPPPPVVSVNGQVGAVVLSIPKIPVTSVNGQTGNVVIPVIPGPPGTNGTNGTNGISATLTVSIQEFDGPPTVGIGIVDGTNAVFTLSFPPVSAPDVFVVGLHQRAGVQYTLKGSTITFAIAPIVGSTVDVSYWYNPPVAAAVRTLGPEAAVDYASSVPSGVSYSQYGNLQTSMVPRSNWNLHGTSGPPQFIEIGMTRVTSTISGGNLPGQTTDSASWYPLYDYAQMSQWPIKINYNGQILPAVVSNCSPGAQGVNIADPGMSNWWYSTYIPQKIDAYSFNRVDGFPLDAQHPFYVTLDGFGFAHNFFGVCSGGQFHGNQTNWAAGYAQSDAEWATDWHNFLQTAAQTRQEVRLIPHWGGQNAYVWANFQYICAYCAGLFKETFEPSAWSDGSQKYSLYQQLVATEWISTQALPIFSGAEPRVVQWNQDLTNDTTDLHTALAAYVMIRGANSFFAPHHGNVAEDPRLWSNVTNLLGPPGAALSHVTVLNTASGHTAGDGFNLISRAYPGGTSWLNMTGSTQRIAYPNGAKDWNGNALSGSFTLGDGQGEVVLAPNGSIRGGSIANGRAMVARRVL